MTLSVIVAMADNRVIGKDGALPWRLSDDLKRFKALTMGHPIVMGRKTWDSIGRPLSGRTNIVLTRDPAFRAEGASVAHSFEAALEAASAAEGGDEVFVIGGEAVYREALGRCDRIYLTEVRGAFDGDARFPEFERAAFRESAREDGAGAPAHAFVVLERSAS